MRNLCFKMTLPSSLSGSIAVNFVKGFSSVARMVKHLPTILEAGFSPWVGKISWRRKLQPTPVLLPGKSHRRRSLVGPSSWGRKESDTTERLHFLSIYLGIYQELPSLPVLCLPVWHSFSMHLPESFKNASDKMTLIPSSFSHIIVSIWFYSWDHLIPSGEGGYLILPLPYWFIIKSFISIGNHYPQNSSFWVGC